MKMKSLLSAAHAAGYVMAPSEELFHAPDGGTERIVTTSDAAMREAAYRANVPALPAPHRMEEAHSWLKGVIGSVWSRRATA